jgi:hypothetical protein
MTRVRKLPNPPRYDGFAKLPPLLDCSPIKVRGMKDEGKPFEPTGREIGADIVFAYDGRKITGQVWCLAPGGVWAVADRIAYLLGRDDRVMEVWNK